MNTDYRVGEWVIRPQLGCIERGDEVVHLKPKPMAVLECLAQSGNGVVSRDGLFEKVWPGGVVSDATLTQCIVELRRAFGDSAQEPRIIKTIPKVGFCLIPEVEPLAAETEVPGRTSRLRLQEASHRFYLIAATVVIVLAIAALLGGIWWYQGTAPAQVPSLPRSADDHSKAYDLYVRGKVKAGSENRDDTEAAIRLLEEAVTVDPNFAEAWTQLARVYNTMAFKFSSQLESKSLQEDAEIALEKALDLNPDLADAHFARGLILWTKTKGFPHEQAIEAFERALELDPNSGETYHQLSMVYAHIGLLEHAQALLRKAIDINPNNTMARFRIGNFLAWEGKFEDAITALKTIPDDVSPMLVERIKAETFIQIGRVEEAQAIVDAYLHSVPKDEGGSFTSVNAILLAKAGKRTAAIGEISRAAEIGKGFGHFHHTAYNIASAYALLNEPDQAIKWLEAAADDGFPCYSYFSLDPNLENLRGHPQFTELIARKTYK